MEGQSEPLDKIISVNGYAVGRWSGRLIGRLGETELHIIKYIIKLPDDVQLQGSYLRRVSVHLKLRERPSSVLSSTN